MILVPRRFAPTGDRFAPEQVIGFTGMRNLSERKTASTSVSVV